MNEEKQQQKMNLFFTKIYKDAYDYTDDNDQSEDTGYRLSKTQKKDLVSKDESR